MKLEFDYPAGSGAKPIHIAAAAVSGETDPLVEVLLCRPAHLEAVPCCSVTRESVRDGFVASREIALAQHRDLQKALERRGVRCRSMPAIPGLPDLCFTRDSAVTTPWGLLGLRPAMPHRQGEVDEVLRVARSAGIPTIGRIERGTVEGGDVCIARPGLVVIGCSGERTDQQGARALADLFVTAGWSAEIYNFDPHFLHLDTQFCMVAEDLALGCSEVLSDAFLATLRRLEIEVLPVSYKEARTLGCNVLALGNRRILSAVTNRRVNEVLSARGFDVETVDVSQFTQCGGGIHCLTMPINRVPCEQSAFIRSARNREGADDE